MQQHTISRNPSLFFFIFFLFFFLQVKINWHEGNPKEETISSGVREQAHGSFFLIPVTLPPLSRQASKANVVVLLYKKKTNVCTCIVLACPGFVLLFDVLEYDIFYVLKKLLYEDQIRRNVIILSNST